VFGLPTIIIAGMAADGRGGLGIFPVLRHSRGRCRAGIRLTPQPRGEETAAGYPADIGLEP